MSTVNAYALGIATVLSVLLPHVQAIIQRTSWSSKVKSRITVGLAVAFGIAGYIIQNGLNFELATLIDPAKLIAWILAIYVGSSTFYARFFRYNGTTDYLETKINGDPVT